MMSLEGQLDTLVQGPNHHQIAHMRSTCCDSPLPKLFSQSWNQISKCGKKSHFSQKVPFCKFTYSAVYLITKQTAQAFVHRVCMRCQHWQCYLCTICEYSPPSGNMKHVNAQKIFGSNIHNQNFHCKKPCTGECGGKMVQCDATFDSMVGSYLW